MPANPLTMFEREKPRSGIERGETDQKIDDRLGRHRCTINAAINRNHGRGDYSAVSADQAAKVRRSRPRIARLPADAELAEYVTARLVAKNSPMTISIELARSVHGITSRSAMNTHTKKLGDR